VKTPAERSAIVKQLAAEAGFSFCGIAKARRLNEEEQRLEAWLNKGYAGQMEYLHRHFDMRLDPRELVPGAKSVVCLMFNYAPEKVQAPSLPRIARYAYGEDYHKVLRRKLKALFRALMDRFGQLEGRVFVDSAPVMERQWAALAGLGWIGKHGLLLRKSSGSWFFLAEIISDLELEPDAPATDHCGSCTACIDACPTDALLSANVLDASRCISYLTIELRGKTSDTFSSKMENWAFGCDICQEVCPWNRFSKPNQEAAFQPKEAVLGLKKSDWLEMTREVFEDLFGKSAVKRTGYEGMIRNIRFLPPAD
jgi:epoxyqueuosine reductase